MMGELCTEAQKSKQPPLLFVHKREANHRAEAPCYQPTFFSWLPAKSLLVSLYFDR